MPAAVGGEELQQAVLDHHRQAERDHQRGEHAAVERALDDRALQHVAEHRHHRHHDEEGPQHGDVGDGDDADRDVARDHREVAVREVHDLHHAEHQRQPAGEQRVQPAGQHPLDDGVYPGHYGSLPFAGPAGRGGARQPEVGRLDLVRGDVGGPAFQGGPALQQALDVRGHPQGLAHVLLDEQHGEAGRQDLRQHAVDALDDHGRQAERQLVEQQHAGVGDQRPADGDRLLLTAGQLGGELVAALAHPVEHLVHPLDRPRALPRVRGADLQVLLDGQRPEQPPALRHHDDPLRWPGARAAARSRPCRRTGPSPSSGGAGRRSCAAASTCPRRSRR